MSLLRLFFRREWEVSKEAIFAFSVSISSKRDSYSFFNIVTVSSMRQKKRYLSYNQNFNYSDFPILWGYVAGE